MNKKVLTIISVAIASGVLFSGCNSDKASSSANNAVTSAASSQNSTSASVVSNSEEFKFGKIQIQALGGGVCGAPSYIAFEKGFFAEEGLNVELVSGTLDQLKVGLGSGQFVNANGDFQWFPAIEQGLDLKIIGGLHKGCIRLVVPPDSDIKTSADLKGKRIGIYEQGGTPQSVATVILANADIDPQTEVEWKVYPLDQMTQAVSKGEIDAFVAWDPFGTLAQKNEGYTALSDIATDPLFADRSCCFLYASGAAISKEPDKVKAIANAYKKSTEWIQANPEETASIIIDKGYVAADDKELIVELLKSYEYLYTTDQAKDDVHYFVDEFKKTGFLSKSVDADKFTEQVYYDIFS